MGLLLAPGQLQVLVPGGPDTESTGGLIAAGSELYQDVGRVELGRRSTEALRSAPAE